MKRYTETELEKIVRIGFSRIDQIIEKACDDLDGIKPKVGVLGSSILAAFTAAQSNRLYNCSLLELTSKEQISRQSAALGGYYSGQQVNDLQANGYALSRLV